MQSSPILYVEDNLDDVFFMRLAFERAGVPLPLVVVGDGSKAIEYLSGEGAYQNRALHPLPCLLLLDLSLPGKNGFEVLSWIREHPRLRTLKVIVVSASGQQLDINLAQKIGILDYVIKPIPPTRLSDILRERYPRWLA